jgi:hypothetical protein
MLAMIRVFGLAACLMVGVFLMATVGVAVASPQPLPLSARLIHNGEFSGFRPQADTHSFKTAKAWVVSGPHVPVAQVSAESARLHKEGFVAALSKFLDRGSSRGSGLSWAMQLGSAKSARAD